MSDKFVNLHNHSDYSLLDGFGTINEYVNKAVELGQPALGLTDHGNICGLHNFIELCNKNNVKPVPGIECYVSPVNPDGARCHKPIRYGQPGQESIDVSGNGAYLHMTLFAMNDNGMHSLYKLVREASMEGNAFNHLPLKEGEGNYYMKPRIDFDMLVKYNDGLIATSGCPSGEIQTRFRLNQDEQAYDYARRMKELFDNRYFIEIMDHNMQGNDIERSVIPKLIQLSEDLDIPLLATNDSHYCNKEDAIHHEEMLCANSKAKMTDETSDNGGSRFAFNGNDYYLKTYDDMMEIPVFQEHPEAVENTLKLASMIEHIEFNLRKDLRPEVEIPSGYTDETWLKKKIQEGFNKKRVQVGADRKTLDESKKRIAHELPVFINNNFMQYMLVVQDYINWARKNGIGVGFGRGCFLPGNMITTNNGYVAIENMKTSYKALTSDGSYHNVINLFTYDVIDEKCVDLELSNGKHIKCTNDHQIMIDNGSYKTAGSIIIGEKLHSSDSNNTGINVVSIEYSNYTGKVYDVQIEGVHNYTVNDVTVHNSVGGSEIAYLMNISDTDPIRHDLMFERFLNPERISPPDVDTDFAASRRDEVVDYVKSKYGESHIANIITFNKFLSKTAIADMARIYGISVADTEKAKKLIPETKPNTPAELSMIYDENSSVYKASADFRELMEQPQWQPVIRAARAIEGRIKTTGVHACGLIMSSHPITDAAPFIYKHNPDKPWGSSCCQWTYPELEAIGLIKMDFLSLSDLDIVSDTIANIKHTHDGKAPDMSELVHGPMNDKATYDMLSRGETSNVFQTSSAGMQSLFKRMHPSRFEDIAASVALYRPGPMGMDAHTEYADRASGKKKAYVINEELDSVFHDSPVSKVLDSTENLVLYQEQIMNISRFLSGFSWGDADKLRKGMGHKQMDVLNAMEPKFVQGAVNNGYPEKEVEELWSYVLEFGKYSFNRAHACSYAIITYETAYLKCHYPAEFMAAILTDKIRKAKDVDDVKNAIREVRNIGLKVGALDIDNSDVGVSAVKKTKPDDPDIVFGISGIKGISPMFAKKFVEWRNEHHPEPYTSLDDFMRSLPPELIAKKLIDGLAGAGAFDKFGLSRRAICAVIPELIDYYKNEAKQKEAGKESLFDDFDDDDEDNDNTNAFIIPSIPDWDWITRLEQEEKRLGVAVSGHPMSHIGDGLKFLQRGYASLDDDKYGTVIPVDTAVKMSISSHENNGRTFYDKIPVRIIAAITDIIEKRTKTGNIVLRGRIESESSMMPFTVSKDSADKVYAAYKNGTGINENHVYVITGNLTIDWNGNHSITADNFDELLLDNEGKLPVWIHLYKRNTENKNSPGYTKLMKLLNNKKYNGSTPVYIHVYDDRDKKYAFYDSIDTGTRVNCSDEFMLALEKMLGSKRLGRWPVSD